MFPFYLFLFIYFRVVLGRDYTFLICYHASWYILRTTMVSCHLFYKKKGIQGTMFQALTRVVDIYIYTFGFNFPSLQRLDHSKRVTLYWSVAVTTMFINRHCNHNQVVPLGKTNKTSALSHAWWVDQMIIRHPYATASPLTVLPFCTTCWSCGQADDSTTFKQQKLFLSPRDLCVPFSLSFQGY